MSRGPVREALRTLSQQGLVVLEPNKGVRVASSPSAEMRPLIVELRRKIETFVVENSFDQITSKAVKTLDKLLENIKVACETSDTTALVEYDLAFHTTIIDCHEDAELRAIWEPIMIRMLMHYGRHTNLMDSYYEHKRIVDAIRNSDKAETIKALHNNIQ